MSSETSQSSLFIYNLQILSLFIESRHLHAWMQFLLLYDTCSLLCYVRRLTVNVTLFIVCYSVQKYRTGQSLPGIGQPSVSAWLHSPLQWYGVASLQSSRERCRGGHQPTWAGLWEEEWGCVSGRHVFSAYITHESCTFKSCWHSSTEWNFFCCFLGCLLQ